MSAESMERPDSRSARIRIEQSTDDTLLQTLLLDYRRIPPNLIDHELVVLDVVRKELQEEWEEESAKYEETVTRTVSGIARTAPRRNYFNPEGIVEDTSLFPYHDHFYALIDAYDCLYTNDDDDETDTETDTETEHPIEPNAVRPFQVPVHLRTIATAFHRQGRPTASPLAVMACVLECAFSELTLSRDNAINDGQSTMWANLTQMFHQGRSRDATDRHLHATRLLLPPRQRACMLVKLLRHALFRRDCYLACSLLSRLCRNDDLDETYVLRRVLAVLDAEYVVCQNPCPDWVGEDHSCSEWTWVLEVLHYTISVGILFVAEPHALVLAAFVKSIYQRQFGDDQQETLDQSSATASSPPSIQLVATIVKALGARAWLERKRCLVALQQQQKQQGKDDDSDDDTDSRVRPRIYLDSFWNCVRALVLVGEYTIQMVPTDCDDYDDTASALVRSFAFCFLPETVLPDHTREHEQARYLKPAGLASSLVAPRRYLDHVVQATDRYQRRERHRRLFVNATNEGGNGGKEAIAAVLQFSRPPDVRDVVRSLFIRNMIDIRETGFGYGDFLVWCGYDVTPLDPVLFWYECQFPLDPPTEEEGMPENEQDEEEESHSSSTTFWERDEAGHKLTLDEIRARYDFTLLALLRAWNAPWTEETHKSFPPGFQEAVRTFTLCAEFRLNLPNEIVPRVAAFLNRDWWPDDRRQCWSHACQLNHIRQLVLEKQADVTSKAVSKKMSSTCEPCSGHCGFSWYCSQECKGENHEAGHKFVCGSSLYRGTWAQGAPAEYDLYRSIFKKDVPPVLVWNEPDPEPTNDRKRKASTQVVVLDDDETDGEHQLEQEVEADYDADDDEESASSLTMAVCKYFNLKHRGSLAN